MADYALKNCKILPADFKENLNALFADMHVHPERVEGELNRITDELKKVIKL